MPKEQKPKGNQSKAGRLERIVTGSAIPVGVGLVLLGPTGFAREVYSVLTTPVYEAKDWADFFLYAIPKVALPHLVIYLACIATTGLGIYLISHAQRPSDANPQ